MEATGAILDDGAGLQALARIDEALPDAAEGIKVLATLEQEGLGDATRLGLAAHEASGHDARLVGDEEIARLEVVDDVIEVTVLDGTPVRDCLGSSGDSISPVAMQDEQTARVARLGGSLGDQLVRQRVVKVIGAHGFGSSRCFVRKRV